MMLRARRAGPGELALMLALSPWERRLARESLERWLVHGAIAALTTGIAVLLIGWLSPQPEDQLRPLAFALAVLPLLAVVVIALWPQAHLRQAATLDTRLGLGDRLTTAWAFRQSEDAIVRLQRADAISHLTKHSALSWKLNRKELTALAAAAVVLALLLVLPSPQQAVIDQQAAERAAIAEAGDRMSAFAVEAAANPALTPEQARQLSDLIKQSQLDLNRSRSQQEAAAVVARAQQQIAQQIADPNADLRAQALAAMSDTLAAEPGTQALADALQSQDPNATGAAMKALEAQADNLSDVERQALSRALQRAANVGRADARTASALRDAAQALSAPNSAEAQTALAAADSALTEAVQSAKAQASVNATLQRLHELESQLASGEPLKVQGAFPSTEQDSSSSGLPIGTPVALDASGRLRDPRPADTQGAGFATANLSSTTAQDEVQPAENVFVPGRESDGPANQDVVDQPFTVRGQPRPYRDVLSQYAASSRDYVDRPEVSPAVRDLVKQYFQSLEEGQ